MQVFNPKQLRILYHNDKLSKFWVGNIICNDPSASNNHANISDFMTLESELISTHCTIWSQRALTTSLLPIMSLQTPRGIFHCLLHGAAGQLCKYALDSSDIGSILPLKQTNKQTSESELISTQCTIWIQRALTKSLLPIMSLQTPRGIFHCPLHGATGQLGVIFHSDLPLSYQVERRRLLSSIVSKSYSNAQ